MDLLAHGIGGPQDLPISASLAIAGAVAALVISFTVLAVAWRQPRFDVVNGRPVPAWLDGLVSSAGFRLGLRVLGLALILFSALAAVFGKDLLTNPFFGIFYVWLWVGIVPLSLLFGPFYKAISPVRTLNALFARLSASDPDQGLYPYPERLGYWPAAVGLYAFVWLELVYPHNAELGPVRLWAAAYVAVMLVGGALFGSRFFENADPFEVYSTLIGHLSPWGRDEKGRLEIRSPLANLHHYPARAGLLGVVGVMFGSTAFDSFQDSTFWLQYTQETTLSVSLVNNAMLLAFCAAVVVLFGGGTMLTGLKGGNTPRRTDLPALFAHSMAPIIVGYIAAHYLSLFVEYGQLTLIQASDPLSTGANYLGTADLAVNAFLAYHPTLLADIKVGGVVLGHILAVVAAHDRAVQLLPKRHQLIGQLALLLVMVCFTAGGLYLLFVA